MQPESKMKQNKTNKGKEQKVPKKFDPIRINTFKNFFLISFNKTVPYFFKMFLEIE